MSYNAADNQELWVLCNNCGQSYPLAEVHKCPSSSVQMPYCVACGSRHYLDTTGCTCSIPTNRREF